MTYPEYTIKLEAENKRLQEANNGLLGACKEIRELIIPKIVNGDIKDSLLRRIDFVALQGIISAKHSPAAQGSRKEHI